MAKDLCARRIQAALIEAEASHREKREKETKKKEKCEAFLLSSFFSARGFFTMEP
jgi:hypothetical protein